VSQFAPEDSQGSIDLVSNGDITFEADRDQDGAGDLVFRTGGVERARIKHDGSGTGWPNVLGGSITYAPAPSGDTTGATDTAAINALLAEGVIVSLGKSLSSAPYWVNGSLNIPTHSGIVGLGENLTTVKRAADVTVISAVGTNPSPLRNCVLAGLTIDANNGQGYVSTLVQQSYLRDPVLQNVLLYGAEGIALDQLEVWDEQTSMLTLSLCGGNNSGAYAAHRIRCSTTDTSNNIHLRGYRNEAFGADGAILAANNGANQPINITLTDYKLERHGSIGIFFKATQGINIRLNGGAVAVSGGLAVGVAQGVDLFTFSGGNDVVVNGMTFTFGSFSSGDVRSLFNFDGSTNAITGATLQNVLFRSGTGSPPTSDIRFAGTVDRYREDNVRWNSNWWNSPHWSGAPTSIVQGGPLPSIAGAVSDSSFDTKSVDGELAIDSSGVRLAFRSGGVWKHLSPAPNLAQIIAGSTGKFYTLPGAGTTAAPTNGTVHCTPFIVNATQTFTALAVNVTVAGTSGVALTRLGIYSDNGSGYPGSLLVDAGTVASDTTGWKTVTISQSLAPGIYWLVAVTQGAPAAVPTYTAIASHPIMLATTFTASVPFGYTMSATGALSGTFGASVSTTTAPVRVWLGT
jgi:hypothetical protein